MPNITDPVAINNSNAGLRTIADILAATYAACKERILDSQQTASDGISTVATVFANNPTSPIDDGSLAVGAAPGSPDGRGNVTGQDATNLLAICQQIQNLFESNGNLLLLQLAKYKVNTLNF